MIAYEVLRIIDSKPLFAKDHFKRLQNSILNNNKVLKIDFEIFLNELKTLIAEEKLQNGNIKIEINFEANCCEYKIISKISPHLYPSEYDYKNGVNTLTFFHVRENPNDKIWDKAQRNKVDNILSLQNVFEVLYVNNHNYLTEGSRSNLFFIENDYLISAKPQDILLGITRKYILMSAKHLGLKLIERDISLSEIENFDTAFISGTSPKVLPIRKINDVNFGVNNKNLRLLMAEYDELIKNDILQFNF